MTDYYGTPAGFRTYWTARGNAVLAAEDDATITIALLQASEWIDGTYFDQFGGIKTGGRAQIRDWPRNGVADRYGYAIPSDVPPREVENATYEGAAAQLLTPGVFFKVYTPAKYTRVAVSGAIDVSYKDGNAYDFQTQLPAVSNALAPIFARSASSPLSGSTARA